MLIAAGTQPNTVLAREEGVSLELDGKYSRLRRERRAGEARAPHVQAAAGRRCCCTGIADGRFMSFFGDLHPSYFGNVVKAMGGAKQGYPVVSQRAGRAARRVEAGRRRNSCRALNRDLRAVVHEVRRLTPTIVEVVLRAPVAARRFEPGQFYRLQNFEALALQRRRAPRSRWKAWRSPAPGSTRRRA